MPVRSNEPSLHEAMQAVRQIRCLAAFGNYPSNKPDGSEECLHPLEDLTLGVDFVQCKCGFVWAKERSVRLIVSMIRGYRQEMSRVLELVKTLEQEIADLKAMR